MCLTFNPDAYPQLGITVRAAYTIGLHRAKATTIFSATEQASRRRLWQSLFILDRLIGLSSGRPMAISDGEALDEGLFSLEQTNPTTTPGSRSDEEPSCSTSFGATLRSCHIIGLILTRVYQRERISLKIAQGIANECLHWTKQLHPSLHWSRTSGQDFLQASAVLHTNAIYFLAITLLTRPFFLYAVSSEIQRKHLQRDTIQDSLPLKRKVLQFSKACTIASNQTIALAAQAFQRGLLSPYSILSIAQIFGAALILLTQELTWPSSGRGFGGHIHTSIRILENHARVSPEARRCVDTLRQFCQVTSKSLKSKDLPPFQRDIAPKSEATGHFTVSPSLIRQGQQPSTKTFIPRPDPHEVGLPLPFTSRSASLSQATFETASSDPSFEYDNPLNSMVDLNDTVMPLASDQDAASNDETFDFNTLEQWLPPFDRTLFQDVRLGDHGGPMVDGSS